MFEGQVDYPNRINLLYNDMERLSCDHDYDGRDGEVVCV